MAEPLPAPWDAAEALALVEAARERGDKPLAALRALQKTFGYVDARAVGMAAKAFGLQRPDLFALLSRHRELKRLPPQDGTILLCLADSCRARGAGALAARLEQALGVTLDDPARGGLRVETALCLRNCPRGPNASFDGEVFCELDAKSVERLIAAAQFRKIQKNA